MRYSAAKLAFFLLVAAFLSVVTAVCFYYLIIPLLARLNGQIGQSVKQFFFGTVIQWCTLGVFYFILVILVSRLLEHRAIKSSLARLEKLPVHGSAQDIRLPSVFLTHRFQLVREICRNHPPDETQALLKEMGERDRNESAAIFNMLGTGVQLMLALGFFGTVWGISRSMFQSFTGLAGTDAGLVSQALEQFTSGLSIALDTTVLGLVCGIFSGLLITALEWSEEELLTDAAEGWRRWSVCPARAGMDEQMLLAKIMPLVKDMVHHLVNASAVSAGAKEPPVPSGPGLAK